MAAPVSPPTQAHGRRPAPDRRGRFFTGARLTVLVGGFLVNVGSFSLYPYLAVVLRDRMGVGMEQIGLILGLGTMVQYGSATITAALAERLGLRRALIVALMLYSLGGVAFLVGDHRVEFTIVGIFLISGAGSLYSPAYRSYLLWDADAEQRPRLVSAGNAAGSLGIAVGPVVGALFVHRPGGTFAVVTVLYAVVAVSHLFLRREQDSEETSSIEPFRRMLHGMAVLPFVLTALTFYLNMQFYQYLAVYTEGRVPAAFYGLAMMGYALVQVAVQPVLAERVERARYPAIVAIGFAGYAVGMVAFAAGRPVTIAAGVAAISLGSALLFLKNDLAALAGSRRSATVTFGQQRLAVGLGASLSGLVGGTVYGGFEDAGSPSGFWLVVAAQCVLLPPLLLGIAGRLRRRTAVTDQPPASRRP